MMNKNRFILIAIAIISIFYIKDLSAFIVQDAGKAFSFGNFAKENNTKTLPQNDNKTVDYSGLVNKMISKPQEIKIIDMSQRSSTNIVIETGKSVEIFLPEKDGSHWNVDIDNKDLVKIDRSESLNGSRLLAFMALGSGKTKVYLDNILDKNGDIEVIQSRIIRFEIR